MVFHSLPTIGHGPLARYVKLRVAHAPGMPGTFSPPPLGSDPDMHHDTCATHVSWCMPGSLTSVFLWSRWRGKRSRHSRRMRNRQFYVSGKRPMTTWVDQVQVYEDVMTWKCFPHYWSFVVGIHQWSMDLSHEGLVMFSLGISFVDNLNNPLNKQSSCRWLRFHDAHVTSP